MERNSFEEGSGPTSFYHSRMCHEGLDSGAKEMGTTRQLAFQILKEVEADRRRRGELIGLSELPDNESDY